MRRPLLLLLISGSAFAQIPAPPADAASAAKAGNSPAGAEQLQRVQVEGRASDDNVRRASTASKIVITREELEKFGDSTLGEVLKRLPGVTTGGRPGRGGEIRMRGMGGGYTQILVNGERMPPGFSLDQLPPEQVERIEVLRAPTAEFGTRAVAGTINVVLREALQRRVNELRAGVQLEHDKLSPGIGWTRNDTFGQGGAYNLTLNAMHGERLDAIRSDVDTRTVSTGAEVLQNARGQTDEKRDSLNFNGRIQLPLSPTSSLAVQPFMVLSRSHSATEVRQQTSPQPSPLPPDFFDQADTAGRNRFQMLRLNGQYQARPDADTRVELRAGLGRATVHAFSDRQERLAGLLTRTQDDSTDSHDSSWNLLGKLSHNLGNDHALVGGLEGEGTTRHQDRLTLVNGQARTDLADFGDDLDASTSRLALYLQDEWNSGPLWDYYLGARWEGIQTRSSAANYSVSNRSGVFTPLAHARYKLDEKGKELIRVSLTRSYRSPQLQDLIARPTINPAVPHQANTPDRAGNPDLKPELATGFEIGYEKYLSKGGLLSANLFARQISDLMRTVTSLETVSWSATPRWVARPENIGKARTAGLELEAKFRADEWLEAMLPINLRTNLSVFTSRVDGIPGPNNRLDAQPKGTLNVGGDYRLRALPLTLGLTVNYTPSSVIQQTLLTEALSDRKLVADAFALWNFDANTSLRLSASNLAPLDYSTGSVINTGDQLISTRSGGPTYTQWQLRLEMKL
jgi:iron complex outermembrane receptor protein